MCGLRPSTRHATCEAGRARARARSRRHRMDGHNMAGRPPATVAVDGAKLPTSLPSRVGGSTPPSETAWSLRGVKSTCTSSAAKLSHNPVATRLPACCSKAPAYAAFPPSTLALLPYGCAHRSILRCLASSAGRASPASAFQMQLVPPILVSHQQGTPVMILSVHSPNLVWGASSRLGACPTKALDNALQHLLNGTLHSRRSGATEWRVGRAQCAGRCACRCLAVGHMPRQGSNACARIWRCDAAVFQPRFRRGSSWTFNCARARSSDGSRKAS